MKHEKCAHKGCKKTAADSSLFSVGKEKFCAEHFTPTRSATKPKEDKK